MIAASERFLAERANKEAEQPPAYYLVAGAWLRLGRALGLEGARLLYFVRALGPLVAGALVLVAYRLVRDLYRDEKLVRWGVPLLAAVFPQDTLFYVTPDVLSPLLGGLCFALSLRLARRPESGALAYAAAGLALAAALLTKWTNAALWAVAAAASLHAIAHAPAGVCASLRVEARAAVDARPRAGLRVVRAEPAALRRSHRLGPQGGAARLGPEAARRLARPSHVLAGGIRRVRDGAGPTFWRGELAWHRTDLALPAIDALYTASTFLLLALALAGLRGREPGRFLAEGLATVAVAVATGLLAVLSLAFVFDATTNPSASHPYFVQGRLISGVLLPFLLVYVRGLEVATARLPAPAGRRLGWALLVSLALAVFVSELALTWPVFASEYNAFHLP